MAATPRLPCLAPLDRAAGRLAGVFIGGYQRWLSPLKGPGRACAHRVLHGGDSCSQHVRAVAAAAGLGRALPAAVARFAACREAAARLAPPPPPAGRGTSAARRRHRGVCCVVIPLPACSTTHAVRR